MKKAIIVLFLLMSFNAYALEVETYVKAGTLAQDELSGVGGHKFITGSGFKLEEPYGALNGSFIGEKWVVGEGMDDDKDFCLSSGLNVSVGFGYPIGNIEPFFLIGYEQWHRGGIVWNGLDFGYYGIGVKGRHGAGYVSFVLTTPFFINSDAENPVGRTGFKSEVGLVYESGSIGLFYDYSGFEDPDSKVVLSGIKLGWNW